MARGRSAPTFDRRSSYDSVPVGMLAAFSPSLRTQRAT
jgi:hypothetical protein